MMQQQEVTFPPLLGFLLRIPGLRTLPARLMAFGLRRVHLNKV